MVKIKIEGKLQLGKDVLLFLSIFHFTPINYNKKMYYKLSYKLDPTIKTNTNGKNIKMQPNENLKNMLCGKLTS
jgi:hypothetical protein